MCPARQGEGKASKHHITRRLTKPISPTPPCITHGISCWRLLDRPALGEREVVPPPSAVVVWGAVFCGRPRRSTSHDLPGSTLAPIEPLPRPTPSQHIVRAPWGPRGGLSPARRARNTGGGHKRPIACLFLFPFFFVRGGRGGGPGPSAAARRLRTIVFHHRFGTPLASHTDVFTHTASSTPLPPYSRPKRTGGGRIGPFPRLRFFVVPRQRGRHHKARRGSIAPRLFPLWWRLRADSRARW